MFILLAIGAATAYGIADYAGGRATRDAPAESVTFIGQFTALLLLLIIVPLTGARLPSIHDWVWSGLGGFGGAIALLAFYRAMSRGAMTVIAPISAVVGLSIPVLIGLLQGERPAVIAYPGILLAIIAVALVGDVLDHHDLPTSWSVIGLAALAGVGFGLIFVCLAQTSSASGLWPLVGQRLVSVPTVAVLAVVLKHRTPLRGNVLRLALFCGVLDTTANAFYLISVRHGLLSLVAVITALYPVSTVVLALRLDHERLHRSQAAGLVLAAISLIMVGYASAL
ncbi:MAG: EamA family transporter [Ilumatobacteraceae bacterium]